MMNETNTEYYTFTPAQEKYKTILLKGLDAEDDPDNILENLKSLEKSDLNFIKVARFKTKYSIQNNKNTATFIVQLSPDSNLSELFKIKSLIIV